jgi:CRP/FNR family transcriptional regulator, cyclic AMP receptor protein
VRKADRVSRLAAVPMFSGCSKKELGWLADATHLEQVEAGETIISEGAPSSNVYVLVTGTATVRRGGRRVDTMGVGDVFGELGLFLGTTRNASVVADGPVELLVLGRSSLRAAVDTVPGLGWKLLESVTERLAATTDAP